MRSPSLLGIVLGLAIVSFGSSRVSAAEPADLILKNGKIETVDANRPRAEALAVRGDRIVAVGSNDEIAKLAGPKTETLDLAGRFAMPGFIESHAHLRALGASLEELNLTEAKDWEEIVALVKAAAEKVPPGQWIVGRGWHQAMWKKAPQPNVEGYPIHTALSAVSKAHPVLLVHRSGHMSLANAAAMGRAGVTRATAAPDGGEILRDAQGELTGVFRETAMVFVSRARAASRENLSTAELDVEFRRQVELGQRACLAKGLTSFQDAGTLPGEVARYVAMAEAGRLDLRMWLMLRASNRELARVLPELKKVRRAAGDRVTVGGIKHMLDGALGAHGAWLLAPYDDLPTSRGLAVSSLDDIANAGDLALEHGLQLCVHAIGDRANRETLDLYERLFAMHPDKKDLRWRVEHAQHLDPADIPRFAKLGVIASMQANHATSDAPFVDQRLGPKRAREGAYAWQALKKTGAVIANGTDSPVEDVDPILCFAAAVTRKTADGKVFYPEQKLTRPQALRSYTLDAAFAAKEEDLKGALVEGKLADIVVLTGDLLALPDDDLKQAKVWCTIVGGRVVYRKKD